jgi:calcium-translocating P-type ATPase
MPRASGTCPWTSPEAHTTRLSDLLLALESSPAGLSSEEAQRRLIQCGPNTLNTLQPRSWWRVAWDQLTSPLVWVLVAAGVVAAVMGRPTDGIVIALVVVLNTAVGILQDFRASKALSALQTLVPRHCRVLRNGQKQQVDAHDLVPGDCVLVAAGDQIPADLRILQSQGLRVVEAALTGESVPIEKEGLDLPESYPLAERRHMLLSGSLVVGGSGLGIVCTTGLETELGKISSLLGSVQAPQTPLTRVLHRFGNRLTAGIGLLAAGIFLVGLWRGIALSSSLLSAVTLAVAAIPEGLPALVTMILAIGVHRMAQHHAVVRDLPAVEALGSTTVICTDKTGTLTQNLMSVVEAWTPSERLVVAPEGYNPSNPLFHSTPLPWKRLAEAALFCNDAHLAEEGGLWSCHGDPTECALLAFAGRCGLLQVQQGLQRIAEVPFDSEHRLMAVAMGRQQQGSHYPELFVKGAVDTVLARCPEADHDSIHQQALEMASRGLRVLALAEGSLLQAGPLSLQDLQGLRFLGLLALEDPPRPEARRAIATCREAGIRVKMITGDHPATAVAIARALELTSHLEVLTGSELAQVPPEQLPGLVSRTDLYARISPEQKLQLIQVLQDLDEVVAMTGDGVNDGPALRRADVGVAMGLSGTAVAREAADLVLLDDRFVTIEHAIEEGRRIFDNLVKSLAFLLPTNFGLALILILGLQIMPVRDGEVILPLTPLQVLWVNLVVAITLALPLAFEPSEPDVMARAPRAPAAPLLTRSQLIKLGAVALWQAFVSFALFFVAKDLMGASEPEAQTVALHGVVLVQILALLECRSQSHQPWRSLSLNPWILRGIGGLVALQLAITFLPPLQTLLGTQPLSWMDGGLLLVAALPQLVLLSFPSRSRS